MHKVISSSRDNNDLSTGFNRSNEIRERELTNSKSTKGNYRVGVYLKYVFGFAEQQNNCTYGLCNKLTLQRISHSYVIGHPAQANDASNIALVGRVNTNGLSWYIPHYTPSIPNQKLMLEHTISKTPTEISYIKRSFYMKDVTTENK